MGDSTGTNFKMIQMIRMKIQNKLNKRYIIKWIDIDIVSILLNIILNMNNE